MLRYLGRFVRGGMVAEESIFKAMSFVFVHVIIFALRQLWHVVVLLLILGQGGKVCLGLALCLFCRRPKSEQNTEGDTELQIFIVILTVL